MTKPVAWMYNDEIIYSNSTVKKLLNGSNGLTPLYKKQEWQGLDMQEIGELSFKAEDQLIRDKLPMGEYAFEFYDLIEQALKEKNT